MPLSASICVPVASKYCSGNVISGFRPVKELYDPVALQCYTGVRKISSRYSFPFFCAKNDVEKKSQESKGGG